MTERRQRPLKAGIVLAAVALIGLIIGFLVLNGIQALQIIGGEGRAEFGEPIVFEAESKRYDIVYLTADIRLTTDIERIVGAAVCEIAAADGSTQTVRGDRQASSSDTSVGASIGYFDVPAGRTTVLCDLTRGGGGFVSTYAVAESRRTLTYIVWGLMAAAIIAGLVGAYLIKIGLEGRAVRSTVPVDG